ncbi:MAG: FkbM family methyltransferase [Magnetococcales bacterium]|nr:FkbM family methyltransferase [Magnetococcales bacterium]
MASEHYTKWWDMVEEGVWEPNLFSLFERFIIPGSTVIDVGAWIGGTALFCAHLASKVFLFEPDPVALNILRRNLSLNPKLGLKMTLIEAGFACHDGWAPIFNDHPGNSGSSLLSYNFESRDNSIKPIGEMPLYDAKRFLSQIDMPNVSLIKIDIEGAEYDVVPTIAPFLQEHRPTLLLSLHPYKLGGQGSDSNDRLYRLTRSAALFESVAHYPYIFHEMEGKLVRRNDKEQILHELRTTGLVSGSYAFSYRAGW